MGQSQAYPGCFGPDLGKDASLLVPVEDRGQVATLFPALCLCGAPRQPLVEPGVAILPEVRLCDVIGLIVNSLTIKQSKIKQSALV